jgi:chromosomal replication initiation ATPase DnaA
VRLGDELGKDDALTPDPKLWQAILARLDVPQTDRDVWLMPTILAHYDDLLVLACPHKQVRTVIRMCYLDHIRAVAVELLGRPVQVETAVTYMPDVTAQQRAAWLSAAEPHPYEAAWRTDEPSTSVADPVLIDEHKQIGTALSPTATCSEGFTPPVQIPTELEVNPKHVHVQSAAEIAREPHVAPPMPSLSEVWLRVYNEVAISLSERRIWLEPTYLLRIDDDHATVSAPNIFVRNRLATHYHDQLAVTLSTIVGRPLRVEVVTESSGVGKRL